MKQSVYYNTSPGQSTAMVLPWIFIALVCSIGDEEDLQNRIVHYFLNIELIKFFKGKIGFQESCLKLEN